MVYFTLKGATTLNLKTLGIMTLGITEDFHGNGTKH
jgi:hypothetical protein